MHACSKGRDLGNSSIVLETMKSPPFHEKNSENGCGLGCG